MLEGGALAGASLVGRAAAVARGRHNGSPGMVRRHVGWRARIRSRSAVVMRLFVPGDDTAERHQAAGWRGGGVLSAASCDAP
eukprot:2654599-Prymnesium_polylepis.1